MFSLWLYQGTWSASEALACSLMSSGRSCWGYLKGYFYQLFTRSCWELVQLRWQKGHVWASGLLPFLAWIIKLDHHWWYYVLKYRSGSCNSWEVKFSQPLWNWSAAETTGPKYVSQNGRTANWCHKSKIFFWASEQDSWRTGLLRELNPWILKESGLLRAEALLREVLCCTNRCSDWYKFGDSLWPSLLLNFSRATVICLSSSSMS